jgi:autotransporter-associated beta strand protein
MPSGTNMSLFSQGMPVGGTWSGGTAIAMGTTIAGISGNVITLSLPALASGGTAVTPTFGFSNNYSGGTFVDQGTLNLSAVGQNFGVSPYYVIPYSPNNGLTISGGTVTMNGFQGQIDPRNTVYMNGGSTLNLFGDNTLAGLVFNNQGGAAPTVNTGGLLTVTGALTSSALSVNATNTLAGALNLGSSGNFAFTVNPIRIPAGSLVETGGGVLSLAGFNTFGGGVTVNNGTLNVNNGGNPYASAVGISGGATLATTTSVTTYGAISLGVGGGILAPASGATLTVNGAVSGTGSLTVTGGGTVVLSDAGT